HSSSVSFHYFLYRSAPHQDLHSFPTRRSSDLTQCAVINPLLDLPDGRRIAEGEAQLGAHTLGIGLGRSIKSGSGFGVQRLFGQQDRKSTRLNSSHVKISYAVFCLKKKNTI